MKAKHPDLYETHARKYQGREALLARRVPLLDCLWNDVLHFSAVHPRQIRDGFRAAGHDWKPRRWFDVDPVACGFDAGNTVIYRPRPRERGDFATRDEDFATYNHELLPTMATLPPETAAYYAEAVTKGEPIFAFRFIPHLLHQGSINRQHLASIEV